ncbi:MAG: type I-D CRISPR-associated protein Cas5/Csc1 [Thermoplasmatota archaeon]
MQLIPIKATLLSPLQYHTVAITRGTKTGGFLGDLAMSYAICQRTGEMDYTRTDNDKPNYKELKESPYLATVFKPATSVKYLDSMVRNTMMSGDTLGVAEGPEIKEKHKKESGQSMYSRLYTVKPLAPDNSFLGYIFKQEDKQIPETIRMGNQSQGLIKLQRVDKDDIGLVWSNLYTLQQVIGKEKVTLKDEMEVEKQAHQYRIVKNVPLKTIINWYSELFEEIQQE